MLRSRISASIVLSVLVGLVGGCEDSTEPAAETGVVLGTATHRFASTPLSGVTVSVGGQRTTTADDGTYRINDVPHGDQVLSATAPSFCDFQRGLRVSDRQTVNLSLTPLDTLVSITGTVFHAQDGPRSLDLQVDGRTVTSGDDGRWGLDDVPLGEVRIEVAREPYAPVDRRVMISAEGQDVPVQLYRQVVVVEPLVVDSYIFTEADSLNANRGQVPLLWASRWLGRRILLGLPPVPARWADHEIEHVQVEVHAWVQLHDPDWVGEIEVSVGVHRLTGAFYENSVDYYTRPGSIPLNGLTVAGVPGLSAPQVVSIDVTEAYQAINPWPGIALTVTTGDAGVLIASSEYGDDGGADSARRPRVRMVLLE